MSEGRSSNDSDSAVTVGLAQAAESVAAPELVAGRWEILGLLGAGGMGTVYRARDKELDEIIALKMIRRDAGDARLIERLRKEVKLSRRVTHKNVARVFDIGEHEGDRFFTMELVDGESLRDHLMKRGALPPARAVELGLTICRGLRAAHEVGVIHRDLKPDNVLMGEDGRLALTDFGIAASLLAGGGTDTRSFVGTPLYMSPEQVDGQHPIDERTDIYALGVVLFEMVTGEVPWQGETPVAVAAARLTRPPPDPSSLRADLPRPLADIIRRAMARDPQDRFRSVAEVEERLASVLALQPTLTDGGFAALSSRSAAPVSIRPPLPAQTRQGSTRLALLPLSFQGPPDKSYLADGLLDDLIDAVSTTPNLSVQSRRQVMSQLKDVADQTDARALGERLGVDVIVEGTLRTLPDARFRLALRLISASDGIQLWAKRVDMTEGELLFVNESSAEAIAAALTKGAPNVERKLHDPAAIDLYLKARVTFGMFDPEATAEANVLLIQALKLAPDDPTLLSLRALVLARLHFFRGEVAGEARAAAERAIEVAPGSGEAHAAMAAVALQTGASSEAARSAALAAKLAPNLAAARGVLGRILAEVGPLEEAERQLRVTIEIDPADTAAYRELARVLALRGEHEQVESLLARIPSVATFSERVSNALAGTRVAMWRQSPDQVEAGLVLIRHEFEEMGRLLPGRLPIVQSLLELLRFERELPSAEELASQVLGSPGEALRRQLFFLQIHTEIAETRGRRELALSYAARAAKIGLLDLMWMDYCPVLANIRREPSWEEIRGMVAERAEAAKAAMKEKR